MCCQRCGTWIEKNNAVCTALTSTTIRSLEIGLVPLPGSPARAHTRHALDMHIQCTNIPVRRRDVVSSAIPQSTKDPSPSSASYHSQRHQPTQLIHFHRPRGRTRIPDEHRQSALHQGHLAHHAYGLLRHTRRLRALDVDTRWKTWSRVSRSCDHEDGEVQFLLASNLAFSSCYSLRKWMRCSERVLPALANSWCQIGSVRSQIGVTQASNANLTGRTTVTLWHNRFMSERP